MRKIISREIREKKEQRNKTIVGVLLIGLMLFSTVGYAFFSIRDEGIEKIKYNDIEFVLKQDRLWHFEIKGYEFATFHNPAETENVNIPDNLNLQNLIGGRVYYSYDSDNRAISEIFSNIGRFMTGVQEVCMDECEEDLPVKNCSENIVIVREGNESLIKQEENCFYITGEQVELIKISDAFIFKVLGI